MKTSGIESNPAPAEYEASASHSTCIPFETKCCVLWWLQNETEQKTNISFFQKICIADNCWQIINFDTARRVI
jgi:hypothetical protein